MSTKMDYSIERKDAFRLCVYTKSFTAEGGEKRIPSFWEEYYQNKVCKEIPGYLGLCVQEKENAEEFLYGIGCDADDIEVTPEGFRIVHIPAFTWAVFKCVGPTPDSIQKAWDEINCKWLPEASYELIPDYIIENYLPGDSSSSDYVSEIWIPVKEKP